MKILQTSKVKLVDLKIQYKKNNNNSDQRHPTCPPCHPACPGVFPWHRPLHRPGAFSGGQVCRGGAADRAAPPSPRLTGCLWQGSPPVGAVRRCAARPAYRFYPHACCKGLLQTRRSPSSRLPDPCLPISNIEYRLPDSQLPNPRLPDYHSTISNITSPIPNYLIPDYFNPATPVRIPRCGRCCLLLSLLHEGLHQPPIFR